MAFFHQEREGGALVAGADGEPLADEPPALASHLRLRGNHRPQERHERPEYRVGVEAKDAPAGLRVPALVGSVVRLGDAGQVRAVLGSRSAGRALERSSALSSQLSFAALAGFMSASVTATSHQSWGSGFQLGLGLGLGLGLWLGLGVHGRGRPWTTSTQSWGFPHVVRPYLSSSSCSTGGGRCI